MTKEKRMKAVRLARTRDGRQIRYLGVGEHPLGQPASKLMSPTALSRIPTAEAYEAPSTPVPAEQGVPTVLSQSVLAQVPRSVIEPQRRTAYPTRTEQTAAMQKSMTPEEYIRKKTFERPAFFAIEDPIQDQNPWEGAVLVAGPSGTAVTGNIKITTEADFECVKIMVIGRKFVDQEWVSTKNFLVNFKDLASGRDFNNVPIFAENFGGDANEPLILPVTLFINRNTAVQVEFINVEPVSTDIYIYFALLGIKYFYPSALNLTTGIPEQIEYKRI